MPAPLPAVLFGALFLILVAVIIRQRRQLAILEREARHDVLTGLPNRRALAQAWAAMAGPKALILIDLVGFKAVNDSHGHIVGDALLRQVAARLDASVPPPGLLARWGGDEFVAILPAAGFEQLKADIHIAGTKAYDLSESGGPVDVWVGARTGIGQGEPELGLAIRQAARNLLDLKASGSENVIARS